MNLVFYFVDNSLQPYQRPGGNPDALSRLEIYARFSSAESHSLPEWFDLGLRYDRWNASAGDKRNDPRKREHPKPFGKGHSDENIRRKQRQEYFCTTSFPVPLHSVHRKKSGDAMLFALLCQIFFVAAAGVGDIPILFR
jgi:hypothetical protein